MRTIARFFGAVALLSSSSQCFDLPSTEAGPASCNLPSGLPALCVALRECKQITALVANLQPPLPTDVRLLIKDSYGCPTPEGKSGFHVCCPENGIDPPPKNRPATSQLGKIRTFMPFFLLV